MEPTPRETPSTPRNRRGLILILVAIFAIVGVIFIGMNLSHVRESERGEAVGNESGVPGPENTR